MPTEQPKWLTVEEAAARCGCSAQTIWRRARAGMLHPRRLLGRTVFDIAEIETLRSTEKDESRRAS